MSNESKMFRRVVPVVKRSEGARTERWVIDPDGPDECVWPTADVAGRLEHELRYGEPTRELMLCAATVLQAYNGLLAYPAAAVAETLRALRRAEAGK